MTKNPADTLYRMKLHEEYITDKECWVLRVPGGWLYVHKTVPVFVPFNNEFQIKKDREYYLKNRKGQNELG